MTEITQADQEAAADILDVISSLLDHVGIGQVADLIRDGEYDEHDVMPILARHRIQALEQAQVEINRLREAINRDIVRFAHCTAMIEIGPQVSKTRRAEHLTEVLRFEEEAIAALTAPHSPTE